MKAILHKLLAHSEHGCQFLADVSDLTREKIKKSLGTHELKDLLNCVDYFYTEAANPHVFSKLEHIKELVDDFEENGVDSFSTRYHYDKKDQVYPLFQSQINVKIYDLHESIEKAFYCTLDFIEGMHFTYCEANFFTREKLKELNFILNTYKKYKCFLLELRNKHDLDQQEQRSSEFYTVDIKEAIDSCSYYDEKIKAKDIKPEELVALVVLSYLSLGDLLPSMTYFQGKSQSELKEKLASKFVCFPQKQRMNYAT